MTGRKDIAAISSHCPVLTRELARASREGCDGARFECFGNMSRYQVISVSY